MLGYSSWVDGRQAAVCPATRRQCFDLLSHRPENTSVTPAGLPPPLPLQPLREAVPHGRPSRDMHIISCVHAASIRACRSSRRV